MEHCSDEETIRETSAAISLAWFCEEHNRRVPLWRCTRRVCEYERVGVTRARLTPVVHELAVMLPLYVESASESEQRGGTSQAESSSVVLAYESQGW